MANKTVDYAALLEKEIAKADRLNKRAEARAAKPKLSPVAIMNDRMRTALGMYGKVVVTKGFQALTDSQRSKARELIETYKFTGKDKGNDPYGEHDFGKVTVDNIGIFWKIDYLDPTFRFGVEPTDPQCRRVMTIMLAEEY